MWHLQHDGVDAHPCYQALEGKIKKNKHLIVRNRSSCTLRQAHHRLLTASKPLHQNWRSISHILSAYVLPSGMRRIIQHVVDAFIDTQGNKTLLFALCRYRRRGPLDPLFFFSSPVPRTETKGTSVARERELNKRLNARIHNAWVGGIPVITPISSERTGKSHANDVSAYVLGGGGDRGDGDPDLCA